ncbi:flagellar motor protein MotB [Brevibacillus sp. SYSU BS000544]|uniref:flagellar motor protein MotB n=1 Tax=Brevibacillus sp. SYSU BS000544 TaxID=3416443 RepID=UPI003CE547D8
MAKKKKHAHHEEHIDETWLIPYADLLTLLLALFIVLFASSQVDAKKFEQLSESLSMAFNGGISFFENPQPVKTPEVVPQTTLPEKEQDKKDETQREKEQREKFQKETENLQKLQQSIDAYIKENKLTDKLQTKLTDMGLMITILDNALFASGRADVRPDARKLAQEISGMLEKYPRQVIVSGHTDNVPIHTSEFPSNWDLSSKRALNFMKILLENSTLDPRKFSATGYGEYHPIASNGSAEGRAKNRRVEVSILRNVPAPGNANVNSQ